ncbi:SRPBCC family protein [Deinococcus koreensis]|uniref:Polyketide cyclase n=1 Tax=Deinococcus koreensis TaxID=2054903 RepID=A0A2K3UTG6_9DEIO|nr:SRPBCC family protein [Deinococcus koreensis]PNY79832.1 polyketide cyclase [Deinococcus koreensis]
MPDLRDMSELRDTDADFSCTRTIGCAPASLWAVWTDVARWPAWDTPLLEARLSGAFVQGAVGELLDRSRRTSRFTLTECVPQTSYAYTVRLPGGALQVRRAITSTSTTPLSLSFRHHVRFTGPLGRLWARALGRSFRQVLPEVMDNLVRLVETGEPVSNGGHV